MSARHELSEHVSDLANYRLPPSIQRELDTHIDAYRAEVLAEDGQAYDGELVMLRGLVRTLRAVSRDDRADVAQKEVRRLLYEHAADERDAYRREMSSTAEVDATPREAARERRLDQLLDTIRTHPGKWAAGHVQELRRRTGGPTQRGAARRDLAELHRRGHLDQHGAADGRYYTLKRRTDGA